MTDQTKRDFFLLVVEKETTRCWSWIGEHGPDGRPVFRGDKAYRVMCRLRVGDVPQSFHVHHKCGNSACVNPRHLVALSPETHRAVHATKDKALKECLYRGQREQIQAANADAARVEGARLERLEQNERREREKLFDRLFPRLWNQGRLREQAIKNDNALNSLRLALLGGKLSPGHVQFFCGAYRGKDEEMILSLLQSRKPHPI